MTQPKFDASLLQDLRERIDLVKLVERRVSLRRVGRQLIGLCPFHNEKTPSFGVVPERRFYHCFGCGAHGDAIEWMIKAEGFDFVGAVVELATQLGLDWARRHVRRSARGAPVRPLGDIREDADEKQRIKVAREIWRQARPIKGTLGEAYLRKRGILIPVLPLSLRFAPSLWHKPTGQALPALVAGVQNVAREIVGVWRIFLDPMEPQKADVKPAKMGLGQSSGCAVRLSALSSTLIVAEGIETALSLLEARSDFTVWAALSAGGFRTLRLPDGPPDGDGVVRPVFERVLFICDTDAVSTTAATVRASELYEKGTDARVKVAGSGRRVAKGYDANDLLNAPPKGFRRVVRAA